MSNMTLNDMISERAQLFDQMKALTAGSDYDPEKFEKLETSAKLLTQRMKDTRRTIEYQSAQAEPMEGQEPGRFDRGSPEEDMIDRGELLSHFRRYGALGKHGRETGQTEPRRVRADLGGHYANFNGYVRAARSASGRLVDAKKDFRSFGEMLQSVYMAYESRFSRVDPRLERVNDTESRFIRAPSGGSEVDPTGGGFLVQTDFSTAVWMLAHDMGEVLSQCNNVPISTNANGIKIPGVNETSRVTGSRWGGVQSYWAAEGNTVTATKPTFRIVEFDLKKLFSIAYMTNELLQDAAALSAIYGQAFSEEIMFMTEDAVIEGSGAGMPAGILGAPATVTVAKEASQSTAGLVKENIDKMRSRMYARSRMNSRWYINQDVEPALQSLAIVVGTGGAPVYLPPGGYSDAPYARLFGRPVIPIEYCSTLGTVGDIILADFSAYTLVDKGGPSTAMSMHVAFLTDEQVFRVTYRVDGRPMWNSALTPFKGTATQSPFVTLAARP